MKNHSLFYWFALYLVLAANILQTGCAMCCGTYDNAYGGNGGTWQRTDPFHGRVGSPFSDPQARSTADEIPEIVDDTNLEIID